MPSAGRGARGAKHRSCVFVGVWVQDPRLSHRSPPRASRRKRISLHLQQSFPGITLVVQWLRSALPVQETWVQSLVRELRFHLARKKKKKRMVRSSVIENLLRGRGMSSPMSSPGPRAWSGSFLSALRPTLLLKHEWLPCSGMGHTESAGGSLEYARGQVSGRMLQRPRLGPQNI